MAFLKLFWVFFLGFLIASVLQIIFFSPISPDVLEIPKQASSVSVSPPNNQLQRVTKLGEGLLKGPEDVAVDENGALYTVTREGWIRRLHRNDSWENWKKLDSEDLLGITTAKGGGLIVCDAEKGLLKFTEEGTTVLASHFAGSQIRDRVAASFVKARREEVCHAFTLKAKVLGSSYGKGESFSHFAVAVGTQ